MPGFKDAVGSPPPSAVGWGLCGPSGTPLGVGRAICAAGVVSCRTHNAGAADPKLDLSSFCSILQQPRPPRSTALNRIRTRIASPERTPHPLLLGGEDYGGRVSSTRRRGSPERNPRMLTNTTELTSGLGPFHLDSRLHHGVRAARFEEPWPIQTQAVPGALEGRDVLGSISFPQTGSGSRQSRRQSPPGRSGTVKGRRSRRSLDGRTP